MAEPLPAFDWESALTRTYYDFYQRLIEHIPQFLGALSLVLVGWLVAWSLRLLTRKFIGIIDGLFMRAAHRHRGPRSPFKSYAKLGGDIVFWSVLLFFFTASAHMLEWRLFSGATDVLLKYLPNVLSGLLIILAGLPLSSLARSAVSSTAESIGIEQQEVLARIAQFTVVLTAIIIGVEQLGISVSFLTTTLIVVAGVLLAGVALAFGLAASQFVANVIGTQATRKHYQSGQLIRIGDIEGYLLEITSTSIILETERGRAIVPAKMFHEKVSEFIENTLDVSDSQKQGTTDKK